METSSKIYNSGPWGDGSEVVVSTVLAEAGLPTECGVFYRRHCDLGPGDFSTVKRWVNYSIYGTSATSSLKKTCSAGQRYAIVLTRYR